MPLLSLPQRFEAFKQAKLAVVVDEGLSPVRAMIFAAAKGLDPAVLNRMLAISGSQIYVTLSRARADAFELMTMAERIPARIQLSALPMLQSVEAREGIHTGISVADRLTTISVLAEEQIDPRKLVKPGHVFPVQVNEGGVLVKAELFEAVADVIKLAAAGEVGVVSDLINEQGSYYTLAEIENLSLPVFTLRDLVVYRLGSERLVEQVSEAEIILKAGSKFRFQAYRSMLDGCEHLALSLGNLSGSEPVLTRVHRENLLDDLFSQGPQSNASLFKAISAIESRGRGLLIYLRTPTQSEQNKRSQKRSNSVFREYGVGAQIIKACNVQSIEILSNSKTAPEGLEDFGISIAGLRSLES